MFNIETKKIRKEKQADGHHQNNQCVGKYDQVFKRKCFPNVQCRSESKVTSNDSTNLLLHNNHGHNWYLRLSVRREHVCSRTGLSAYVSKTDGSNAANITKLRSRGSFQPMKLIEIFSRENVPLVKYHVINFSQ